MYACMHVCMYACMHVCMNQGHTMCMMCIYLCLNCCCCHFSHDDLKKEKEKTCLELWSVLRLEKHEE